MKGYWLFVCPNCDNIWCGDDPLYGDDEQECFCGTEVKPGFVEDE